MHTNQYRWLMLFWVTLMVLFLVDAALAGNRNTQIVVSPEMETVEMPESNANAAKTVPERKTLSGSQLYNTVKSAVVTIATEAGMGSGFMVSANGYILTNWHVVFNPKAFDIARQIRVKLLDGRIVNAQAIKTDPEIDIALLKISGTGYESAAIGDANELEVGDDLFIIGAPNGLEHSMTTGIVSGVNRDKGRIQTSAVIHKGNSGGPVFDDQGDVVAIAVSAALSNNEAWIQLKNDQRFPVATLLGGISYLIPINHAANLLNLTR